MRRICKDERSKDFFLPPGHKVTKVAQSINTEEDINCKKLKLIIDNS